VDRTVRIVYFVMMAWPILGWIVQTFFAFTGTPVLHEAMWVWVLTAHTTFKDPRWTAIYWLVYVALLYLLYTMARDARERDEHKTVPAEKSAGN
jgi:hypothetical protein